MQSGNSQTSSVEGADKENSMPPPVRGPHGQYTPILYGSAAPAAAVAQTRPNVTNTQQTVLNQASAFQHRPRLGPPFIANASSIPAGRQLANSGSGQPTYSPITAEQEWEIRNSTAAMLSETMHIAINRNAHCGIHNCPVCVRILGNVAEGSDQVDDAAEYKPDNLYTASESPLPSEVERSDVVKQFKKEFANASILQEGPRSETSSVIFLGSISAMASLTPPSSPCPYAQGTSALAAIWEKCRETDEAWHESCENLFPSDFKIRKWAVTVGKETTQLLIDAYADARLDSDMPTSPKRLKVGTNAAVPVSRHRSFADRWEEEIFRNIYDSAVLLYKKGKAQVSGSSRPQHKRHISGPGAISQSVADEFDSMSHTADGKRRLSAGFRNKYHLPLVKEESSSRHTPNRAIKKPLSPRVASSGPSYSEITSQNVTDGGDATDVDPFGAYNSMLLQNKLYPGNTAAHPITISSESSMRNNNRVSKNTFKHKPHHPQNSLGGASLKFILGLISDIVDGGCDCGCLDGARAVHMTALWAENEAAKQFVDEVEMAARRYVAVVGAPVARTNL